jgi:transcriptional regulator with XRE-family HTH domain/Zn-dependent peptidase ImmA (M78 family)
MNRWDKPDYQRIAGADLRGNRIHVQFEDNSVANLAIDQVAPKNAADFDWARLRHTPFEIVIPTSSDDFEIPWTTFRTLTDDEFSSHLASSAEQEACQIGIRLKELREAREISSKDLAKRARITPQSLSRIENARHDVTFTTLQRILAAMGCSLIDLTTPRPLIRTLRALIRMLKPLGFTREFITTRVVPVHLRKNKIDEESVVEATANVLSSMYGWSVTSILEGRTLSFAQSLTGQVLFKGLSSSKALRTTAYTLYVHWLAVQTVESTPEIREQSLIKDPLQMRDKIVSHYGSLSFHTLLSYAWDCGFVVLPLADEGIFHGACWKIKDRVAIVIKQKTDHQARWLFDLAHELAHAILHISDTRSILLEPEEISQIPEGDEEEEASDFAQTLIFKGKVEQLAKACVQRANGDLRMLKSAIPHVAHTHGVPADALANYMAYRLSMQNKNWWGAANNLQVDAPSPLDIAKKEFHARVHLDRLNSEDRLILAQALQATGGGK